MLLSGDEFANTQWGNNNAYCQDNEVSWLDWGLLEKNKKLYDYVMNLIAFRKAHPVLRADSLDYACNGTGYPELSFHSLTPWAFDENAATLTFAYLYAEDHHKYKTNSDCFIYVAVNAHWEEHFYSFPALPEGFCWSLAFEAYGVCSEPGGEMIYHDLTGINLGPRTTAVLIGRPSKNL